MNKKGILGTILLSFILALIIIAGFLYIQIKTTGINFKTGNFIIDIKYDDSVPVAEFKDANNQQAVHKNETNSSDNSLLYNKEQQIQGELLSDDVLEEISEDIPEVQATPEQME